MKFLVLMMFYMIPVLGQQLPLTPDYVRGLEVMKAHRKPGLLLFVSRDECEWSNRLFTDILEQPAFYDDVKQGFVFIAIDFSAHTLIQHEHGQTYPEIKEQYGVETFPLLILLSPDGEEITRLGFPSGGRMGFGETLSRLYREYTELVALEARLREQPSSTDLKDAYQRAVALQCPTLIQLFLERGLELTNNGYFLAEHYSDLVAKGEQIGEEAKLIRRRIMRLKGDDAALAKMRLAVLNFQELHATKPTHAVAMIHKVLADKKLPDESARQLSQLLAGHFIHEKELFMARRFAEKLKASKSALSKHNGEELLRYIEKESKH